MATVNFSTLVTRTDTRFKNRLMRAASYLTDADEVSSRLIELERGESHTIEVEGLRLLSLSVAYSSVTVAITVNGDTITLNVLSCLLIPFSKEDEVVVVITNPAENPIQLPSKISYVTV